MGSLKPHSLWPFAAVGGLAGGCLALLMGAHEPLWAVAASAVAPALFVLAVERFLRWWL